MPLLFLPPAFSTPQSARARRIRSSISSPPPPPPASPPASSPDKAPALGSKNSKKKRPLRPSFEEQALHRWSARAPSQRTSFPWQQQHHEDQGTTHLSDQEPKGTTSATLQSIVDYFNSSSLDSDGEGMGEDGVMHGEAVGGEELRQQRPIGGPAVHAPWMHVAESSKNQWGVELLNGDVEESGDKNGVWDQLGLVDGEGGGMAKNGNCDQMPQKELVSASLDGELYERCSVQPSNSSYGIVVDQGSCGNDFDKSSRKGSVSNIVETLRDSMQENSLNVALDRAAEGFVQMLGPVLLPWEREEEEEEALDGGRPQKSSNADLAERTIPDPELRRLRDAALRMKERMVVGPGGVTQTVVESIHRKWKEDEVVKMRFEGPPSLNMRRTHEILEDKTGGIVIWRSGRSLVLYRGMNYSLQCVQSYASILRDDSNQKVSDGGHILQNASADSVNRSKSVVSSSQGAPETFDIDSFLNQLGPRYKDWSGRSPIPVDADLLPGVVPGYKPPFRLLPYKIKSSLRNREMTTLRRLARQTAPHFALGRNRQHQGLANAIVKLWEKSSIVKIAIKRGVPNTCNDRMAEEIKKLTGGVLLSRNKEYIVFYRGNDFITPKVRQVLVHKQQQAITQQDDEELARLRASASITILTEALKSPLVAGTLAETKEAKSRWGDLLNDHEREKEKMDLALAKHKSLLKNLVRKLVLAKTKVAKAEKALAKVQEFLDPAELPTDLETVTDEERFLFRRIGLKMRAFLLLGRREVFDGTVQNMHFHWKHRELVKIIVKGKNFAQIKHIAISLEAESGGVLISLDKTTKGYAIIFYRGKNYKRPQILKPRNLLTRRQALARSVELQRREALNHHISILQEKIQKLKSQLYLLREQMKASRDKQDAALLLTVEDDLLSDDDNIDDEGEEAYLQTYSSSDEEYTDDSSNEFL